MTIEFVLTCGFLSLGGLALAIFSVFDHHDLLFNLGTVLSLMGTVPLVVFWYHRLCDISRKYNLEDQTDSTNEEDPHENA